MTTADISFARICHQHIGGKKHETPGALLSEMLALQAQDFNMVKWAVGVRLPGIGIQTVMKAIDQGELIRTHVLRPTWHLTNAKDLEWMMDLTAPHIHRLARQRHHELELTGAVLTKSLRLIHKALDEGTHLTREELFTVLERNRVATRDQRGVYILLHAELEKLICSGKMSGKKPTYALFHQRVRTQGTTHREEALGKLATKYFQTRGPASLPDFSWWSGLPVSDAKKAIALAAGGLREEKIGGQTYWCKDIPASARFQNQVHLLPAFDEYIISYKDRTASLPSAHASTVISKNGIFWPVVLLKGKVIGTWKRALEAKPHDIQIHIFPSVRTRYSRQALADAKQKVNDFFSTTAG